MMRIICAVFGLAMMVTLTPEPASAWQVARDERVFAVVEAADGMRFVLACSPDTPRGLLVRATGRSFSDVQSITMQMTMSGGRVAVYRAQPRDDGQIVRGILPSSAQFLTDFQNGIRFQLIINGAVYMDTDMSGTANARAAIRSNCGV